MEAFSSKSKSKRVEEKNKNNNRYAIYNLILTTYEVNEKKNDLFRKHKNKKIKILFD